MENNTNESIPPVDGGLEGLVALGRWLRCRQAFGLMVLLDQGVSHLSQLAEDLHVFIGVHSRPKIEPRKCDTRN